MCPGIKWRYPTDRQINLKIQVISPFCNLILLWKDNLSTTNPCCYKAMVSVVYEILPIRESRNLNQRRNTSWVIAISMLHQCLSTPHAFLLDKLNHLGNLIEIPKLMLCYY